MIGSLLRPEGDRRKSNNGRWRFYFAKMGQCRSLSAICVTGSGQLIAKPGIVVADATSRLRRVAFGNEITHLDVIAERLKAMGKSLRN